MHRVFVSENWRSFLRNLEGPAMPRWRGGYRLVEIAHYLGEGGARILVSHSEDGRNAPPLGDGGPPQFNRLYVVPNNNLHFYMTGDTKNFDCYRSLSTEGNRTATAAGWCGPRNNLGLVSCPIN